MIKEKLFKYLSLFAAVCSIIFLFGIIFSIFREGLPIFSKVGILKFLFGKSWYPTQEPPEFGILALIIGSIVVTIGALVISIPLGVGSAIYLSEMARPRTREILKPFIELLAGIPSVIYGLFGMAFLAPLIMRLFNLNTGLNAFTASIVLGLMVVPIISSISEDAIAAVPKSLREAAYALGANRWETIRKVVLPAAKSGIFASIILGFGRAIGETMVVLMVAGGSAIIPKSIFQPVRPMTSAIAAEMGETVVGDDHYRALFGIAIILFIITFTSNLITESVKSKIKRK
ncbi:MAG: phosphate ABC transporter permease subunit PstC [candidate division WOR-3 bacterium]